MSEALPEIARLTQLFEALEQVPINHQKRNAGRVIAERFGSLAGVTSNFDSMALLFETVGKLPDLIKEQFPETGRQAAALGNVDRLRELFSPESTGVPFETFMANTAVSRTFLVSTMMLLADIQFDAAKLKVEAPDIIGEIGNLRSKLLGSEGLSHASKSVVDAQLSLMERSLLRFDQTGVGPFRDSIFSSIGRIYIELRADQSNDKVAVRDTLDDVLRVYGLMEAGGTLLSLGAPIAMKLLGSQ